MKDRRLSKLFSTIVAAVTSSTLGCSADTEASGCKGGEVVERLSREISVRADGSVVAPGTDAGGGDAAATSFDCMTSCRSTLFECSDLHAAGCAVLGADAGISTVRCDLEWRRTCPAPGNGVCGRRPNGLVLSSGGDENGIGALFARMSALEAASVPAFRTMYRELRAIGAPRALQRAAVRAARDEVAHARLTRRLARRYRARVASFSHSAPRSRELVEIAIENAAEGCVREAFGALLATYQAAAARDVEIRATMRRIARDETEHAALARRVDRYLLKRLSRAERAAVQAAREHAIAELGREVMRVRDTVHEAGEPSNPALRALFERACAELWR